MRQIRTEGIVLRVKNRNESDRLLTVLSPDLGKILILARGARQNRFLTYSLFAMAKLCCCLIVKYILLNQTDVKNTFLIYEVIWIDYIPNLYSQSGRSDSDCGEIIFPCLHCFCMDYPIYPTEIAFHWI